MHTCAPYQTHCRPRSKFPLLCIAFCVSLVVCLIICVHILPQTSYCTICTQGDTTTIYDYVVNASTGQWELWSTRVPLWKPPKGQVSFGSLLVPTADSVCHEALLRAVHSVGRAGMLVGGAGVVAFP